MNLLTPLPETNRRVLKTYANRLEKLGIFTLEDFLYHLPSRYEDYSVVSKIGNVQAGETVTIQGQILEAKNQYLRNSRIKTIQKAIVFDETGSIELGWFNQPFLIKTLTSNSRISASGRVEGAGKKLRLQSPEFEMLPEGVESVHTGRLIPVYPETKGVSSKWLRRQIHNIISERFNEIVEFLPPKIINSNHLMALQQAIQEAHYPHDLMRAQMAKTRLSFDELFLLRLASIKRRTEWQEAKIIKPLNIKKYQKELDDFISSLPFRLTNAQQKSVNEILDNLGQNKPMNRLLQGDVGSGKTVVAAVAMYCCYLNGSQSILLAPTEILAQQHFATIKKLLEPFGITVDLVTGSKKLKSEVTAIAGTNLNTKRSEAGYKPAPASRITKQELRITGKTIKEERNSKPGIRNSNEMDILVGTHALLNEKIKLDKLALVVIDEQQRFGVEQRTLIRKKGESTHLLTMTATPIPRTVALTMYGDLDLSYLDEMPVGRKRVKTWLVPAEKREAGYKWIEKQIKETDSQVFIICPFIEESESMQTVKAAAKEYARLKKEVFPDLKLGLLHGKLKPKEKESVMSDFKNKKFDILVATPVVEVGIDIPNATIIMIEASDRFGLAQLHQLRGRVGRGEKQSYCLLYSDSQKEEVTNRLKALEKIYSGAELAELDLKLRGPGDVYGTAQHGVPKLKVASFSDTQLIRLAGDSAKEIFPKLSANRLLEEKVNTINLKKVSPD